MPSDDVETDDSLILAELINRYAKARVEKSWMGSRPPDEHSRIRRKLKRAREQLEAHLSAAFGVDIKLE